MMMTMYITSNYTNHKPLFNIIATLLLAKWNGYFHFQTFSLHLIELNDNEPISSYHTGFVVDRLLFTGTPLYTDAWNFV